MKEKIKRIMLSFLVFLILLGSAVPVTAAEELTVEVEDAAYSSWFGGVVVDGIVGLLLSPIKFFILIIANILRAITGGIAAIGGTASGGTFDTIFISPDDILFNELDITNINFFDFNVEGPLLTIRKNVAIWYYALRNLSIVVLLAVLVYVGIRMALSTMAEDNAKYKKMLVDWVVSFVLIFVLHYIIIFTININNGLVDIFATAKENMSSFDDTIDILLRRSANVFVSIGMASALMYMMLVAMTIIFLVMYIKRMITIAFLIMISPIITLTYSIDKMGDGKSQALNAWLKEFVFNILIQPFHCLIYLAFVSTAIKIMNGTMASSVLAIIMLFFIFKAESIVKNIFGFNAKSLDNGLVIGAALGSGLNNIASKFNKKEKGGSAKASGPVNGGGEQNLNKSVKRMRTAEENDRGGGTPNPGPSTPDSKGKRVAKLVAKKGLRTAGNAVKQVVSPVNSAKAAMVLAMAAAGGASGKAGNIVAGGMTGLVGAKMYGKHHEKAVGRKNDKRFASAYEEFEKLHSGESKERLAQRTEDILHTSLSDVDEQDQQYAKYVHAMKERYAGDEDPDARVMETLNKVQNGEILPTIRGAKSLKK